jgi:acetyltransferase-like isoleucine patch superfamily enzyme
MSRSHGTGLPPWQFKSLGSQTVFEHGVLVFHPENVSIGSQVYVGHYAILKGYYKGNLEIGDGVWIGQQCFLHSAGNIRIGNHVGIGPGAKILTSSHSLTPLLKSAILHQPIELAAVEIGEGCDLGVNSVILPGVSLGELVQVAAGAVVTKSFPARTIVAGVPARAIGQI